MNHMQRIRRVVSVFGITLLLLTVLAATGMAENTGDQSRSLYNELAAGFDYRINLVGYGIYREVEESPVNSGNIFIIPRYQMEAELRPDFYLNFRRLELILKPRFEFRRLWWEDGILKGSSDNEDDEYINEWLARLRLSDKVFISYGRENLQWGPAYLLSPSNPFNRDNGRNNPELELAGMDFARLVLIPNDHWTASLIANVDKGEQDVDFDFSKQRDYFTPPWTTEKTDLLAALTEVYGTDIDAIQQRFARKFKKTYAAKIDYTADGKFFSFIPSVREDDDPRFGFFGGWNATNALLLYAEGSIGSDSAGGTDLLAGSAYTLTSGANISFEYFHKEEGCTDDPLGDCFAPGGHEGIIPGDAFIRKNYGFVQYYDTGILNSIDLTLRMIYDFDDQSSQGIGIVQYEVNDNSRLFFIGNLTTGDDETEFGSFLDYMLMMGASYTF